MKDEPLRDRYPLFSAFGEEQEFLGPEESIEASTEARIVSIWPFLKRRASAFCKSLKPRERVNFDPEDVLLELWVALREKDEGWTPERGKYITYAGTIVDRELCSIRDRSRTVESPRNSSGRMKEYQSEEESGELTHRRRVTASQILRTNDISPIASSLNESGVLGVDKEDPAKALVEAERKQSISGTVSLAIRNALTPYESSVIGRIFGLWGESPKSTWRTAWETATDTADVRKAKNRALDKMRARLLSVDRPITPPWI